ncbi:MAG: RHS repeat-associated core domain-containing protein [Candidatus Enteromonas sp.]
MQERQHAPRIQRRLAGQPTIKTIDSAKGFFVSKVSRFLFKGYFHDEETGFYYLESRYYDPELARFISTDEASNLVGAIHRFLKTSCPRCHAGSSAEASFACAVVPSFVHPPRKVTNDSCDYEIMPRSPLNVLRLSTASAIQQCLSKGSTFAKIFLYNAFIGKEFIGTNPIKRLPSFAPSSAFSSRWSFSSFSHSSPSLPSF